MQTAQQLLKQHKRLHKEGHFQGRGCLNFYREIRDLVQETHSKTLLDYGCGKGAQFQMTPAALHAKLGVYIESWREGLGVESITGYDPATLRYQKKPTGTFDGVYCTSVLEHLNAADIPGVLNDVFQYAEKFVFLAVGTTPAKKQLPSGENAHATIQPFDWWLTTVEQVAREYPDIRWVLAEEKEKDGETGGER